MLLGSVAWSSSEKREQPGRQRHEGRKPLRARPPERRQPRQPERDRQDADEEPDDPVAEESLRRRARRLDRSRDLLGRLDAARARHADRHGLAVDPFVRHDDGRRPQPAERAVAVQAVGDDRVVDGHRGERDVVALRVRDLDLDLPWPELDPADVQLVTRRRVLADELEQRVSGRREQRDRADERDHRHQRPDPPSSAAELRCE
jgi:hypothetical protein